MPNRVSRETVGRRGRALATAIFAFLVAVSSTGFALDDMTELRNQTYNKANNHVDGQEDKCCQEQGQRCCGLPDKGFCKSSTVFNCSGDPTDYRAEDVLISIFPGQCVTPDLISGDPCCDQWTWLCCGKTQSYQSVIAGACAGSAGCIWWYFVSPGCYPDTAVNPCTWAQ
jgi:hypothetical protein